MTDSGTFSVVKLFLFSVDARAGLDFKRKAQKAVKISPLSEIH